MSDFDPTGHDQPAPVGLFGLASPGKVLIVAVVGGAFLALLSVVVARWWLGYGWGG